MVNLPSGTEAAAAGAVEAVGPHRVRRHRWGASRRNGPRSPAVPTSLADLEAMAEKAVMVALGHRLAGCDITYAKAMEMLRSEHNMNFMMICDTCHRHHDYDELEAPER